MSNHVVILTCEHATDAIPSLYQGYFRGAKAALNSHRGIDFGAKAIAAECALAFKAPLFMATVSRLLVDCNRSPHHPGLFSEWAQALTPEQKQRVLEDYYYPYRKQVRQAIASHIQQGAFVLHLSIHSFTPILEDDERSAEIGLLYDSKSQSESQVAVSLKQALIQESVAYRVKMNYPYKGTSDGLTTNLRQEYTSRQYAGIEIEFNQALTRSELPLQKVRDVFIRALSRVIGSSRV